MSDNETIDLDSFFKLPEVDPSTGTTHKESKVAEHLFEFARTMKFNHFSIEDWVNDLIKSSMIEDTKELRKRYMKLSVFGSYNIQKGAKKGQIGYYTGSPVLTALKKIQKVYISIRGSAILIIPEEKFVALKKAYKNKPKAQPLIKTLENNFSFMYDRSNWKPLK